MTQMFLFWTPQVVCMSARLFLYPSERSESFCNLMARTELFGHWLVGTVGLRFAATACDLGALPKQALSVEMLLVAHDRLMILEYHERLLHFFLSWPPPALYTCVP